MKTLKKILKYCGKDVPAFVMAVCGAVSSVFEYLARRNEDKKLKAKERRVKQLEKEAADVADAGSMSDLVRFVNTAVFAAALAATAALQGCMNGVRVMTANEWEGHYYSRDEAADAVNRITLGRGQSVWIISNETMKYILKKKGSNE